MARRRPVLVAVRLTPGESADWRAKAAAAGVPLSALIRRAMARTRTWTARAVEVEHTGELARLVNNLNEAAPGVRFRGIKGGRQPPCQLPCSTRRRLAYAP